MNNLSFMTIGDSAFFHTIRHSVAQIARFYPGARVFVYDMGFTPDQRRALEGRDATVVRWSHRSESWPLRKYAAILAPLAVRQPKWFLLNGIGRLRRNLTIFRQKPELILDCLRRCGGNLVFLDGDAILAARIDEVFEDDFNVGVTLRRQHEIRLSSRDGECRALNVGVMFFKYPLSTLEVFVRLWNDEIARTTDYCIEQTALSNMVESTRGDIYSDYYLTGRLVGADGEVKVKVFPCETYNFNWIEEGFDPVKNKILHFKGGRHTEEQFDLLSAPLELDRNP